MSERSTSRGRDYTSSGRGGIGNIHAAPEHPLDRPTDGPDDFSVTRGREVPAGPTSAEQKIYSVGRGGLGNMRSPSRDNHGSVRTTDPEVERAVREHSREARDAPVSTGRGGLGNIDRSRSRPPPEGESAHPHHHHHNLLSNLLHKHSHDEPRPSSDSQDAKPSSA